jgi:peptidoglycan/xylan/chitin deacetylase (PgdA/CDA1 family)
MGVYYVFLIYAKALANSDERGYVRPFMSHCLFIALAALFAACPMRAQESPAATTNSIAPTSSPATVAPSSLSASTESKALPTAEAPSAIILGYHQFTQGDQPSKNIYSMTANAFAEEMKYLKDSGCHVVPLSQIVDYIEGKATLPPHAVAITVDDGYKSPVLYAAPILKQYGYPWTFFCYTDYVNSGSHAASWQDLQELQSEGVDIECHSKSHPFLSHKSGKSDAEYDQWLTAETAGAKTILEQHLNKKIVYFAYPFGNYNKQVQDKLVASGYEAIFTVAGNPVRATTSLLHMGRYVVTSPEEKDFTGWLRQGALSVVTATPAPGATESNPRPVISATLDFQGQLDPKSIEATVKGYGPVPVDFDAKTSTVRLYLQRDLIEPAVNVTIHIKDAQTKQTMVASWQFNYDAPASTTTAPAIGSGGASVNSNKPAR